MKRVLLFAAVVALHAEVVADEPGKKYQLVTPKPIGIMATGLNDRGDLVGFEWVEEKKQPDIVSQRPFYASGKTVIVIPLLDGYTATHPAAVSDTGLVVGRVSKPSQPGRPAHLRNQAFIWDKASGIHGLGALDGDSASFACGVTRDGKCISGVSVGEGRIRACTWERNGMTWRGSALPQRGQLGTQNVVISNDGRFIASIDDSVPCLWSTGAGGTRTREVIGAAGAFAPLAVNNSGTVVGRRHMADGLTHAVIWTREAGMRLLEEPAGFVTSEASAINNAGVVVGMVDGPQGSTVGPNAFVYENGRLRLINECGPAFASATAINDKDQVAGVLEEKERATE
jgi:probable HAF family extracellular repeat protein